MDLAQPLPELTVVLDHLGKPPLPAATENFDSGRSTAYAPSALRPAWEVALEAFGPRRLMLGTDCLPHLKNCWPRVSAPYRPRGRRPRSENRPSRVAATPPLHSHAP
ncbi:amidohydrolase [Sinomonas sp. 5-5]|uniref:Amidohydrolase n=1 Tax=Sinomonas terrae TaxID=2908838 RepID=A0ABS9U123_9MICC|nr:amidohydrolase [Sinomonas terrae]